PRSVIGQMLLQYGVIYSDIHAIYNPVYSADKNKAYSKEDLQKLFETDFETIRSIVSHYREALGCFDGNLRKSTQEANQLIWSEGSRKKLSNRVGRLTDYLEVIDRENFRNIYDSVLTDFEINP